jgi:hypothetical protein
MESVGGPVRLIQGAKGILANAMKIEVVTATRRATAGWTAAMAATGTVVPIVFAQPTMPALMHKVTST